MASTMYGYARVSSREQNLDRQLDALRAFGVEDGAVYADKASGKDFERPAWHRLMGELRPGDVLAGSRASTGWDATMPRSWTYGATSRRRAACLSWCSTCRYWTRARSATA